MPNVDSLGKLFVEELRDLLDAEKQVRKALPKMVRAAESDELKAGFEDHLRQTDGQIERLNRVFDMVGERARGQKCDGMENLIRETDEMVGEIDKGPVRDALLIAGAQKVEHYEMSSYGTVRTWANQLGHEQAAGLLEETLEEEKETDARLTDLAERMVNQEAARAGGRDGVEKAQPSRGRSSQANDGAKRSRRTKSGGRPRTRRR